MSLDPVAGVLARISTIESRFGIDTRTATTASDDRVFESYYRPGPTDAVTAPSEGGEAPSSGSTEARPAADAVALEIARFVGSMEQRTLPATREPIAARDTAASTASPTSPAGQLDATSPAGTVDGLAGVSPSAPDSVPYADEFEAAGARHGVPPRLLAAIGWVESNYQPDVVSPAGAIGLMQLMPFVADHLGVDARDPVQAIDGAARLLADHHRRFGSWDLAAAAYFSGAGAVAKAGNTIPTERSAHYVDKVQRRMAAS